MGRARALNWIPRMPRDAILSLTVSIYEHDMKWAAASLQDSDCYVIILLDSTGINCTKLNKCKIIRTLECVASNPFKTTRSIRIN